MTKYIALLRGVNVGGKNKIAMPALKAAFEESGFKNVVTYINSGNLIFDSELDEGAAKIACEKAIADSFGLNISAMLITAEGLRDALERAPDWWNKDGGSKHNAIFVIPPATAESIIAEAGEAKPEYERLAFVGRVIFWSAPLETFSHTRWSQITRSRAAYAAITIRNANTALALRRLAEGETRAD